MRSYSDASSGDSDVKASFIPTLSVGDFSLSLAFDPHQIERPMNEKDRNFPFWMSWSTSFIDAFSWHSSKHDAFVVLDRTTPLSGDPAGFFPGINHTWDGTHERLSLESWFRTGIYSQRFFAEDISLSRYDTEKSETLTGLLFTFDLGRVDLGSGLMASVDYGKTPDFSLLPEIWLDVPLMITDSMKLSMSLGGAFMFSDIMEAETAKNMGWGTWISFPVRSWYFDLTLGAMWQSGSLWYGRWNEYYKPIPKDNMLALYANYEYRNPDLDLAFDFLWNIDPFDPGDMSNTFADISVGFSMGNIDALIGFRKQDLFSLYDMRKNSDFYFGIETATGSLKSSLVFRFKNGLPELGFSSSLALIDTGIVNAPEKKESDVNLKFDLGFRAAPGRDVDFFLSPVLTFGRDNLMAALRVPLVLAVGEDVEMISLKADSWWDMFHDVSTVPAVFDSFTDLFVFIDSLRIATEEDLLYIDMSRTEPMNDVFFENYKSYDALSMTAGINFTNLGFRLWIDDLESPRILDPMLAWYPFASDSAAFILSAPTELLMKDWDNMEITSFFGLSFAWPFFDNRLKVSAFAYGEIYAKYEDGIPVETRIIYDFQDDELEGYMLGGQISWTDDFWHVGFACGINSCILYPNYWNSFTSMNPDRDKTKEVVEGMSVWTIAEAGIYFDSVSAFIKYSLPDMASLWLDERILDGDMLTFILDFTLPNGVGMKMKLSRLDLVSTIGDIVDIESYMNSPNTIYAFGLTKEFENMTLEAELSSQAWYEESRSGWMNSYSLKTVAPGLSLKTRIGF